MMAETPAKIPPVEIPALRDTEEYHVFIAHSTNDRKYVESLTKELEDHGFLCFMYERDLDGVIWKEVTETIQKSRRVIMVVTPAFIQSAWSIFEAKEAMLKEHREGRMVLVPILYNVTDENIPNYLRPYRCYSHKEKDFDALLLKALTRDDEPVTGLVPAGQIGYGLAWSYYYGFLKIVLPGIVERSESWLTKQENPPQMLKKMVIIIPLSCRCPNSFPKDFTHIGHIEFETSRAGNEKRNYKSPVYKVQDPDTKEEFLFIGEFATPLLAMWEMEQGDIAGLTNEDKKHQRMIFGNKLQEILYHIGNEECTDKSTYLEYDDEKDGLKDLPRAICKHIREELKTEQDRLDTLRMIQEAL